ncbi:MAG TPA: hypothetical protein VFP32_00565 [Candidatus Saccharimonadales bacterium]|nr:hypothetical protein [Candidatus Saccharimonadales bacterium]
MSKAEQPGGFPEFEPTELDVDKAEAFTRSVLKPAAIYLWGTGYRDPRMVDRHEDVYKGFDSPNFENFVALTAYIHDGAWREEDETKDDVPPEPVIAIDLDALRPDAMESLPKRLRGLTAWDCQRFRFPVNGDTPWVEHYWMLEDKNGRDITDPKGEQETFLIYLDDSEQFSLARTEELNSSDLIDIRNILLTIGVPAEIVMPEEAEQTGNT